MKLTRLSGKAILVAAALLLFASSSALAQTQEAAKPASEVDQLKQRLQQLEQTVTEVKGQIEAIETKKKDPAPVIIDAKYSETAAPAETTPAEPTKPQDNGKGESTFTIDGFAMVTLAVERPGASGDQGVFQDRIELQGIRPKFDLPDLSGNVRFTRDWGYLQVAGMLRRIKWVDTTDDAFDLGGTEVGAGMNITSNLKFTPNDTGRFAFVFGQGIQN